MKIASWNVNSIRARQDRLIAWLGKARPDIICLQETKAVDDAFPLAAIRASGYEALFWGQKAYNGVAILGRGPVRALARGFNDGEDDLGARFLLAEACGVLVASVYVPNGREVGTEHYAAKLAWLGRLRRFLDREVEGSIPLALCGDWNITPDDRDVWDPEGHRDSIHCHPEERAALEHLMAYGLVDTLRLYDQSPGLYSWWDYRELGFVKDRGMRLDLVLASKPLAVRCTAAGIDREERKGKGASDHTPVWAEFA